MFKNLTEKYQKMSPQEYLRRTDRHNRTCLLIIATSVLAVMVSFIALWNWLV